MDPRSAFPAATRALALVTLGALLSACATTRLLPISAAAGSAP